MGNSSSQPKVTAQDKAILDLKNQRDKLHQYQRRLHPLVAQYHSVAIYHLRANEKPKALLALRRKKYQESLLSKTDSQLAQLERLTSDVEFALVQKDVVFGLQRGAEVLKDIRKEMGGVEGVEKLMARTGEEQRYTEEVGEMLRGQMSREEEDEVEDELEGIEREEAVKEGRRVGSEEMPEVPDGRVEDGRLPTVPQEAPDAVRKQRQKTKDEDPELVPA